MTLFSNRKPKYRGPVADPADTETLNRRIEVARLFKLPKYAPPQLPITKRPHP